MGNGERFTSGKRFLATAKDIAAKWGSGSDNHLRCGLCDRLFVEGDGVRWVYANGNTPSFGNFFTCDSCDGADVLERRTAAGLYAKQFRYEYIPVAAELLKLKKGWQARGEQEASELESCSRTLELANYTIDAERSRYKELVAKLKQAREFLLQWREFNPSPTSQLGIDTDSFLRALTSLSEGTRG